MSTYIQLMATDPLVRIGFKRLIQGWGWGEGGEVLPYGRKFWREDILADC